MIGYVSSQWTRPLRVKGFFHASSQIVFAMAEMQIKKKKNQLIDLLHPYYNWEKAIEPLGFYMP